MDSKKEQLLKKVYDEYINLMLYDFPVDKISEIVVNDVTGYGTTLDEKVLEINRLKKIVSDQREQGAGLEMQIGIMPVHRRISPEEDTAIYMDEFEISMIVEGTKNSFLVRLSSVFEFSNNTWKLVHLHGSKAVETEDDTWHLNEWKQKSEQLQKLVDEKTAELTKQNREFEIQAALERVRSRAMAMHKSEELQDVISDVFIQMQHLGIKADASLINILTEESKDFYLWIGTVGQTYAQKIRIPYIKHPVFDVFYEAHERGETFMTNLLTRAEKDSFFEYAFKYSDLKLMPDARKKYVMECAGFARSFAWSKNSGITIQNYAGIPYSDHENEILKRFAQVFEQAYTRFLDVKNAEMQARKAQIESAMEKVRSRSLAMRNTAELTEVLVVVYDKLIELNIDFDSANILIFSEHTKDIEYWTINNAQQKFLQFNIPYEDFSVPRYIINARERKQDLLELNFQGKEHDELLHFLLEKSDFKKLPEERKKILKESGNYTLSLGIGNRIGIQINSYYRKSFSDEENEILKRFTSVFEQAYTRFLDLQKAEAQAREAQIEAALERVRASTMAMHKSEQLAETAKVLFEQFDLLGKIPDRISIGIFKEEKQLIEWWVTNQNGSQLNYGFNASITEPSMAKVFSAWKEKKDSIVIDLTGKDLQDWIRFVREEVKMEIDEANMKGRRVHQGAFFSQGVLLFSTHKPVADDVMQLLVRFARVFNQTYTRFLDLQKAEAQAKEAIKTSSLDRVRGEIASMRTVNDLQRITPIIWHELIALGVPFVRCGVFIIDDSKEHIQVHLSSPNGSSLGALDLPFNSSELTINSVNHWRQGIIFKTHWDKQDFLNFMQSMIKEGQVLNPKTYQGAAAPPESLDLHFIPFKQGMLYVGNSTPLEIDELQLVKSLAESFSIAYARYEDFRQLESAKNQIEKTFTELKAAQSQLIQSEKMASLGELTAGVAHEIQNPLNFVNNFSELSNELMVEMKEELAVGNVQLANEIASDISQNLEKINHHGKRAADIVKGMLQHSRTSSGQKEPTDINALADEYFRLAYHGLRAKDKSFNAKMNTDFDATISKINIIPQDIGRVILNLITNAFYVVDEKKKLMIDDYEPVVSVSTKKMNNQISISVKDNGPGIPLEIKNKIFQPFFTTKPTGQGTGLGLSLSYDIVRAHGGELKVETMVGEGSEFIIQIPTN
jgi:signal transduction histidine kinase